MKYRIEVDNEDDGRWIAELIEIPGVIVYGVSKNAAIKKAKTLTLKIIAEEYGLSEASAVSFNVVLPETP